MKVRVNISNLYESTFRFYIQDEFRKSLFLILKEKYRYFGDIAQKLKTERRNLFSVRKGWRLRKGEKRIFMINAQILKKIKDETGCTDEDIERNIVSIKHGLNGLEKEMGLPIELDSKETEAISMEGALFDYMTEKQLEEQLNNEKRIENGQKNKDGYVTIFQSIEKEYVEGLRKRGLKPVLEEDNNFFYVHYRMPGTNKRKAATIPKRIVFDEEWAKQFGKWMGDRCGGPGKIGVANIEWTFVEEFEQFIKKRLYQKEVDVYMTLKEGGQIPEEAIKNIKKKICKTQLGDYAYRAEVSNAILKHNIFDICERDLYEILRKSKRPVRLAFYAGLFEAEGSIERKSGIMSFSFGSSLNDNKKSEELMELHKKAVALQVLLKEDGFKSRISRKCARTKKSSIIKYDINLLTSKKTREWEVSFINETFLPYITHPTKLKTFEEVFPYMKKKTPEGEKKTLKKQSVNLQPVLNIGTVGQ